MYFYLWLVTKSEIYFILYKKKSNSSVFQYFYIISNMSTDKILQRWQISRYNANIARHLFSSINKTLKSFTKFCIALTRLRIKSTIFEIKRFRILHRIFTRGLPFESSHFIYSANVTLVNGDRHRWCIRQTRLYHFRAFVLFHDVEKNTRNDPQRNAEYRRISDKYPTCIIWFPTLSRDIATFVWIDNEG